MTRPEPLAPVSRPRHPGESDSLPDRAVFNKHHNHMASSPRRLVIEVVYPLLRLAAWGINSTIEHFKELQGRSDQLSQAIAEGNAEEAGGLTSS